MKFCVKCGNKLEDNDMFCPKCGHKSGVEKGQEDDVGNTQTFNTGLINKQNNDSQFKEDLNKEDFNDEEEVDDSIFNTFRRKLGLNKKVAVIIGIGVLCITIFVSFLIGNAASKPSNVVSKFQKAVASSNKGQLVDILYCSDNRLKIDEKSVAPLINYFKDNPSYLNEVVSQLNNEVARSNGNLNSNSKGKFDIVYAGKKYLFFKDYKIGIKPSFISVKTGIKDVQFSLNSTQIAKSDSKDFSKQLGPFIPGKYKLNADYKNSYESLNESRDIDFMNSNEDSENVEVFKDVSYVNINSDYPDAEIFLNNKDTGVKAKDASNFGPLAANSSVYGVAAVNGQKLRSSDYILKKDDDYIKLDFTQSQTSMQIDQYRMRNLIYWYTYYFTQAVNTGDFEDVENYLYPGSPLYNDQKSYVATTYEKGIKEDIKSFNVISYNLSDDKRSGTVSTEEVYNIYQSDSTTPSTKTFHYTYTFKYNEQFSGYQLSDIKSN
ncbi:hypothetical protein CLRAG_13340 [Clostridium ragsdalei P11]|uniref:Membrane-associated protein TcaA n=1 Tax=Clostridium ragsdalei P11 TaxID=1353534 RepID=A0A1A6AY36_9CLOT|nr:zinc-ribbon domain-containing protein [Clostridium ragsdalei]OBR94996.1 hypothetical protein CLRAG_13340 [Clostridium ragsdalei P11]